MSIIDFDKVDHDKVYRIVLFFAPVKDMTRFLFVHLFVLRDNDCNAIISNRGNEIRLRALRGSFLGTLHRSPPEDNANFMTRFTRVILSEGAKVDGV